MSYRAAKTPLHASQSDDEFAREAAPRQDHATPRGASRRSVQPNLLAAHAFDRSFRCRAPLRRAGHFGILEVADPADFTASEDAVWGSTYDLIRCSMPGARGSEFVISRPGPLPLTSPALRTTFSVRPSYVELSVVAVLSSTAMLLRPTAVMDQQRVEDA